MQVNPFPFKRPVRVEMVPLIDMFFLILTFFIYGVFWMSMQEGILVELPRAATSEAAREEAVTISLDAQGVIFLDRAPTTLEVLLPAMRQVRAVGADRLVIINADRQVAHGTVISVLDTVRQAGLQRVSFQTDAR